LKLHRVHEQLISYETYSLRNDLATYSLTSYSQFRSIFLNIPFFSHSDVTSWWWGWW